MKTKTPPTRRRAAAGARTAARATTPVATGDAASPEPTATEVPAGVAIVEEAQAATPPVWPGVPGLPAFADPLNLAARAESLSAAVGGMVKSVAGLKLPLPNLVEIQSDYLKHAGELWNHALGRLQGDGDAEGTPRQPPLEDRRFGSPAWTSNPAAAFIAQVYLLNSRTLMQLAEGVEGDAKTRARIRFAVQQWIDAASPSNYLALNPDALKKALDTGGQSIKLGIQHLLEDVRKGHVSQTDESLFEVGRNVATTAGSVVFENRLFQLIEYKPLTAKVHERPMLFVPPCINKYYILDLQPENSVIRYTVEQGHRVFVMSWRNPDESMAAMTWDDYIEEGPLTALRTVRAISGAETINTLGFCVGGTILCTALAVLAARGARLGKARAPEFQPAHSVTLLTTLLDFGSTGILDIFIDEAMVGLRDITLGDQAAGGPRLLKGKELATTFSFLRPNDLVWNYVVGNYLKGETPPPFDLLYWNGDSTNLPGPMYCWYLRHTYLTNELKVPGRLTVCGEKVDLGAIEAPFFVYGSREDHIVPWAAAYASIPLLKGERRFVLGASGHIAGVINPPAKGKRSHWVNDATPAKAEDWFAGATEQPGSWWPAWTDWLKPHGGRLVDAPRKPGSAGFEPLEPAPGRYVKVKA